MTVRKKRKRQEQTRRKPPEGQGSGMLRLAELLEYALDADIPDAFLERLLEERPHWDGEFVRRLDELAYEFRPDLAVWYVSADEEGRLHQYRLSPRLEQLLRD